MQPLSRFFSELKYLCKVLFDTLLRVFNLENLGKSSRVVIFPKYKSRFEYPTLFLGVHYHGDMQML